MPSLLLRASWRGVAGVALLLLALTVDRFPAEARLAAQLVEVVAAGRGLVLAGAPVDSMTVFPGLRACSVSDDVVVCLCSPSNWYTPYVSMHV